MKGEKYPGIEFLPTVIYSVLDPNNKVEVADIAEWSMVLYMHLIDSN